MAFKIYLCGPFRDLESVEGDRAREALARLLFVQEELRRRGYDAFTQRHSRAPELAGGLEPLPMTRELERASDLTVYVALTVGRDAGWVAELVYMAHDYPEGSSKRILLAEWDYPLSAVLDADREGVLSVPYIRVIRWQNTSELIAVIERLAYHVDTFGRLPKAGKDIDWR